MSYNSNKLKCSTLMLTKAHTTQNAFEEVLVNTSPRQTHL